MSCEGRKFSERRRETQHKLQDDHCITYVSTFFIPMLPNLLLIQHLIGVGESVIHSILIRIAPFIITRPTSAINILVLELESRKFAVAGRAQSQSISKYIFLGNIVKFECRYLGIYHVENRWREAVLSLEARLEVSDHLLHNFVCQKTDEGRGIKNITC